METDLLIFFKTWWLLMLLKMYHSNRNIYIYKTLSLNIYFCASTGWFQLCKTCAGIMCGTISGQPRSLYFAICMKHAQKGEFMQHTDTKYTYSKFCIQFIHHYVPKLLVGSPIYFWMMQKFPFVKIIYFSIFQILCNTSAMHVVWTTIQRAISSKEV